MVTKIEARHLKSVGLALVAGAVVSAATLKIAKPVTVYENNQLVSIANFVAHDNGWPFPFYHYACFPFPRFSCSQYVDWWALVFNIGFWAIMAAFAWFAFRRIRKHRPRKKH